MADDKLPPLDHVAQNKMGSEENDAGADLPQRNIKRGNELESNYGREQPGIAGRNPLATGTAQGSVGQEQGAGQNLHPETLIQERDEQARRNKATAAKNAADLSVQTWPQTWHHATKGNRTVKSADEAAQLRSDGWYPGIAPDVEADADMKRQIEDIPAYIHRAPNQSEKDAMSYITDNTAKMVDFFTKLGGSRELDVARQKIEEAAMWAVRHISAQR